MNLPFETLISTYLENGIGIAEYFLTAALSDHLKENLLALHAENKLLPAGTGNADNLSHNTLVRSDAIYWLDNKNNNVYENEFFSRIEAFIDYINKSCYTGINSYEFHYTVYERGSFYVRHRDQFKGNTDRAFSMISYLNNNWQQNDGGELLIHHSDQHQKITPTQGKTVFFKSDELEHEVLLTNERRMSITGWLKRI